MFCQNCGSKIDDDSKFCANCGAKVEDAASAENTAQNPVPAQQEGKDEFFRDVPPPPPAPMQQQIPVQPAYQQPVYMQAVKTNVFAIIGFVLSFFSSVAIAGLIFSIIGLKQCNNTQEKGKGLAIAGIVISSVVIFIEFIVTIVRLAYGLPIYGGYDYFV